MEPIAPAWPDARWRLRYEPPFPFSEYVAMVGFLFLFAPTVVLIAVLIMQRFQPRRDRDPGILMEYAIEDDRMEPRFSAVNDNAEYEPDPGIMRDQHSIVTG
jgi:hypothetical protein